MYTMVGIPGLVEGERCTTVGIPGLVGKRKEAKKPALTPG